MRGAVDKSYDRPRCQPPQPFVHPPFPERLCGEGIRHTGLHQPVGLLNGV